MTRQSLGALLIGAVMLAAGCSPSSGRQSPEEPEVASTSETAITPSPQSSIDETAGSAELDFLSFDFSLQDPADSKDFLGVGADFKVDQHLLRYEQVVDDPEWGPLAIECWGSSSANNERVGFVRAQLGFGVEDHGTFETQGGLELWMGPALGIERASMDSLANMSFAVGYTTPECDEATLVSNYDDGAPGKSLNFGYKLAGEQTQWGPVPVLLAVPFAFTPQAPDGDVEQLEAYSFLVSGDAGRHGQSVFRNSDGQLPRYAPVNVTGPTTDVDGISYPDAFKRIKAELR